MVSPSSFNALQRAEKLLHHHRREAQGQLVDDEDQRIRHEAAPDRQHLLLAARERAGLLAAPLGKAREQRQNLVEALRVGARGALRIGAQLEIFLDRHGGEELPSLGHEDEAARRLGVRRKPRHILAGEDDAPAPRRDAAEDRPQGRRLAGAVRADDGGEMAGVGLERNVPQHLHLAIAGGERGDFEERPFHHASPRNSLASSGSPR